MPLTRRWSCLVSALALFCRPDRVASLLPTRLTGLLATGLLAVAVAGIGPTAREAAAAAAAPSGGGGTWIVTTNTTIKDATTPMKASTQTIAPLRGFKDRKV